MRKIKVQIDENRHLISYCDLGDLKNSIEIEVEDNFKFEGNLRNYILLKNNTLKYAINLKELKQQKREELKQIRDLKVRDNVCLYGVEFQIRNSTDIENFKDIDRALEKGFKQSTDKRFWILADNSIKEFTYEQLSKVLDEKAKRKEEIYNKFGLLSMEIEKAKTVEEIEAIKWED